MLLADKRELQNSLKVSLIQIEEKEVRAPASPALARPSSAL